MILEVSLWDHPFQIPCPTSWCLQHLQLTALPAHQGSPWPDFFGCLKRTQGIWHLTWIDALDYVFFRSNVQLYGKRKYGKSLSFQPPTYTTYILYFYIYYILYTPSFQPFPTTSTWNLFLVLWSLNTLRTHEAAKQIHDEGRAFLRSYRNLCSISIRQEKNEFPMKPKYHVPWWTINLRTWFRFSTYYIWEQPHRASRWNVRSLQDRFCSVAGS